MRYEVIAELAINEYSITTFTEVIKAAKTLRRLRPHDISWYKHLLLNASDAYTLNKKMIREELLIDIYPAPKP